VAPDELRDPADLSPQLIIGREGLPRLWGRQGFWQIRLRWAVAPTMILAIVIGKLLGFEFPVVPILVVALASPIYNALFALTLRRFRSLLAADSRLDRLFIATEVVVDYAAMFLLIYLTGGASSPLAIFLLFHVIIAAIQFTALTAYALAGVAAGGLWLLFLAEAQGWFPCHHLAFRGISLDPVDQPAHTILGLLFLTATLFITAGLVNRISARLRSRVGDLADANADLARSHAAIQELMQERAQFTLQVAHNLRAPLAAGLGIIDLLREGYVGPLTDKQQEQLGRLDLTRWACSWPSPELVTAAGRSRTSPSTCASWPDTPKRPSKASRRPRRSASKWRWPRTCHRWPPASGCSSS
jgi:two-component system sensor histidine kinase RegB